MSTQVLVLVLGLLCWVCLKLGAYHTKRDPKNFYWDEKKIRRYFTTVIKDTTYGTLIAFKEIPDRRGVLRIFDLHRQLITEIDNDTHDITGILMDTNQTIWVVVDGKATEFHAANLKPKKLLVSGG